MAGGARLGLLELLVELALEIAQAAEVLVDTRLVLGTDGLGQLLRALEHARQHALAHHGARAGLEIRQVRILEVLAEHL